MNITCIAAIFALLTSLAALRIEVGNDYGTYVVTCHEIFQHGYVVTEPGYNLVVRILYTLSGSENYLLMFGVFGAAIVAIFLKSMWDESDSFVLSMFLFMFLGLYFRSFNTVRYYFALAITLFSLRYVVYVNYQNILKFIVLILVAATFHKSVLVVIPMYLICRIPWKKWMYIVVTLLGIAVMCSGKYLMPLMLKLYPSYEGTVYADQVHSIFENAPIIARCVLVLVLALCFYKDTICENEDNSLYFKMNICAIILYICCYWMPLVTRFGYYLITSQILLVPNILCRIKDERKRRIATICVVVVVLLYFVYFLLTGSREGIRVIPYKSWLFHSRYWLNQTDTF